jgi:hypothetical protein
MESVRAYPYDNSPQRGSRCIPEAERDDGRALPCARTRDVDPLGMRVEDFDAIEPAGNRAQALAADVGTLSPNEALLPGVEARPGGRILIRGEKADDAPQEGNGRDRARPQVRSVLAPPTVRQCRAERCHDERGEGGADDHGHGDPFVVHKPERDRRGRLCRSGKRRIFGSCLAHA